MPFTLSNMIQVGLPVMSFATAPSWPRLRLRRAMGTSLIVREPIGVVAPSRRGTTPAPDRRKVAPALACAARCAQAQRGGALNAFILAEIIDEVGVPPVCSTSSRVVRVGEASLAPAGRHGVVHRLDRPASGSWSWRPERQAGRSRARGKSPNVILDDADFDKASRRCGAAT